MTQLPLLLNHSHDAKPLAEIVAIETTDNDIIVTVTNLSEEGVRMLDSDLKKGQGMKKATAKVVTKVAEQRYPHAMKREDRAMLSETILTAMSRNSTGAYHE